MTAITIENFMQDICADEYQYKHLDTLVLAIASRAIEVQKTINSAKLSEANGPNNTINIQKKTIQNLNTKVSDIFVESMVQCNHVVAIGCEEINDMVFVGVHKSDSYIVQMNPIDHLSPMDEAIGTGSIFGIWKNGQHATTLRLGREQIAALYIIYVPCTMLVIALNNSVQGFTLNPVTEQFELTHKNMNIPKENYFYSINENDYCHYDTATQHAVAKLKNSLSLHYSGCLVADIHHALLTGGIFLSPKDSNHPNGQLRLMYQANPLSFIVEQAGGLASSGSQRILDIPPKHLHQQTSLIIGNKALVNRTLQLLKEKK